MKYFVKDIILFFYHFYGCIWFLTCFCAIQTTNFLKSVLSSVRQFLASESPLKMMENAFYFTSKAFFVLKIFKSLSWFFGHVAKRLDRKDKVNFKFYDFTAWSTNTCNTHIAHIVFSPTKVKGGSFLFLKSGQRGGSWKNMLRNGGESLVEEGWVLFEREDFQIVLSTFLQKIMFSLLMEYCFYLSGKYSCLV